MRLARIFVFTSTAVIACSAFGQSVVGEQASYPTDDDALRSPYQVVDNRVTGQPLPVSIVGENANYPVGIDNTPGILLQTAMMQDAPPDAMGELADYPPRTLLGRQQQMSLLR